MCRVSNGGVVSQHVHLIEFMHECFSTCNSEERMLKIPSHMAYGDTGVKDVIPGVCVCTCVGLGS